MPINVVTDVVKYAVWQNFTNVQKAHTPRIRNMSIAITAVAVR